MTDRASERRAEMRVVSETDIERDFRQAFVGRCQKLFGAFYSSADQIAIRRYSNRLAEGTTKIMWSHVDVRRELLEPDITVDILLDVVEGYF